MSNNWILDKVSETNCVLSCNDIVFKGTYPGCVIKFLELADTKDNWQETKRGILLGYDRVKSLYDDFLWPDDNYAR